MSTALAGHGGRYPSFLNWLVPTWLEGPVPVTSGGEPCGSFPSGAPVLSNGVRWWRDELGVTGGGETRPRYPHSCMNSTDSESRQPVRTDTENGPFAPGRASRDPVSPLAPTFGDGNARSGRTKRPVDHEPTDQSGGPGRPDPDSVPEDHNARHDQWGTIAEVRTIGAFPVCRSRGVTARGGQRTEGRAWPRYCWSMTIRS